MVEATREAEEAGGEVRGFIDHVSGTAHHSE